MLDKVKIGGATYSIVEDNALSAGRARFGEYRPVTSQIAIDANLTGDEKEHTLVHEIGEVIKAQNDLEMSHQTLSTFCSAFYQVLKDNRLKFGD